MTSIAMIVSQFLILSGASLAAVTPQLVTISSDERNYFTAAVFEHARLGNWMNDTPADFVAMNLDYYDRAAEVASSKEADMIVFPEYGFFPPMGNREKLRPYLETIPDHKLAKWNPCQQTEEFSDRPILRRLSCMARVNQIVIVSTMGDIRPCTKDQHHECPDDGFWHHNANVAFDRDGTLIGVYRKERLFFEKAMDLPPTVQDPTFTTDFGTFAMFICFDRIFERMASFGRNTSIDAVLLTTMTIDRRPLLTSVQQWSAWALGNGANYIIANTQLPGLFAMGSGIFAAKMGALRYTYNPDGLSKLVVSRVPRNRYQEYPFDNPSSITIISGNGSEPYDVDLDDEGENIPDVCHYKVLDKPVDVTKDYRCLQEKTTNYTFQKLTGTQGVVEACNNGLCCTVTYEADSMDESFYLGVFNGTHNSFDRYYWCEEKCFVVRCDHFNGSECNTFPSHSRTVFRKLELKSNFTTSFVYPSIVKRGFRLSPVDEWSFGVQDNVDNSSHVGRLTYESNSNKPMLVASMNARCYARDPPYVR